MNLLKSFYQYIPNWLKNKYAISIYVFLIWIMFFDTNTILSQIKMKRQIANMKAKQSYYQEQIKVVDKDLEGLQKENTASLEKFARENYYMKKNNEDVFVIMEEEEGK